MLRATLGRIDGRPYGAYRDLSGSYDFGSFTLHVERVQPDPFAPPSRLRISVPLARAGFPADALAAPVPLADFLLRAFERAIAPEPRLHVDRPGQKILERTAVSVGPTALEVRLAVDLPAAGRRILGRQARAILEETLPAAVESSLFFARADRAALARHLALYADQVRLREILRERGWVGFVADGSILPRESGRSDRPMPASRAVPFAAPPEAAAEVELPNAGRVRGLPVRRGVTLIVGGGYHGKSTLLRALAHSVYPHVGGDGRELVATVPTAVWVRAEDGRVVTRVDIAPYLRDLPGASSADFSTEAASGSTSQAANIAEALEMGADCLLVDEDTSAANFLARDARMQALVPPGREPIVPFIDRVRELHQRYGISVVVVAGGSGSWFDVADAVIRMHAFRPEDVTEEARRIAATVPGARSREATEPLALPSPRIPLPAALLPREGGWPRVRLRGPSSFSYEERLVDLGEVPQLVDDGQTEAIADLMAFAARRYVDGRRTLRRVLEEALAEVDRAGLEAIAPHRTSVSGGYVRPRIFEAAAAWNRLPGLAVRRPDRDGEAEPRGEGGWAVPQGRGRSGEGTPGSPGRAGGRRRSVSRGGGSAGRQRR